jgi:hypothetical protein
MEAPLASEGALSMIFGGNRYYGAEGEAKFETEAGADS